MSKAAVPGRPLRVLMSEAAAGKWGAQVGDALASVPHRLVTPDENDADIAFVSRDVTGLSTKHEFEPHTARFYEALRSSSRLRWVHIHSAGADRAIFIELRARGVEVTTSAGANALPVAQTAVMGVLALARHLPKLIAAQRERRWASLMGSGPPRDLQGQTAVIVGWGAIGREIGRLLAAIGLRVVPVRREPAGALHDALPTADWLVLACSLTPQSRGLIGARELALLPAHAHLVNVSRGEVVDEPALIEALVSQRLAGAYLDVFAHEPLPAASPLWDLPNVIVTPHSAGLSAGNEERVAAMFLQHLRERY